MLFWPPSRLSAAGGAGPLFGCLPLSGLATAFAGRRAARWSLPCLSHRQSCCLGTPGGLGCCLPRPSVPGAASVGWTIGTSGTR
eukprot:5307913-Alexandrium_andersonii.AAC.1